MTQNTYNVRVEYDVSETPPDTIISDLHENLSRYDASIGSSPAGGLTVRLFLEADSPVDAGTRGVEYVQGALLKHEIWLHQMTGFEVLTEEEFDRRLAEPLVPELAGLSEVAQITGTTKSRASQLRSKLEPYFVQELASGPVYLAAGVRTFAEKEYNRTPGVRRTEIPLTPLERALLETLAAAASGTEVPSPGAGHQVAAGAIEGVVGNGHQLQLHAQPADSDVSVALDNLIDHGLVRIRKIYKKETKEMDAGHEEDLVVSLTGKGERHSGIDTPSAGAAGQEEIH
ncbi:hypothetical protein OG883_43980 [Streptomyces sp. NBC_01142]|uniref:hypothetical protein n=1 Tax=Streptomyces sp. NBC_01142 TaxID=2975865 RepID=UPI0022515FF3|nr:hypothetical protein [Streptomyces sp. NBC_01142]MCX4826602.1 hypothetical protein [Streptomyces sp. NBC_01142]